MNAFDIMQMYKLIYELDARGMRSLANRCRILAYKSEAEVMWV